MQKDNKKKMMRRLRRTKATSFARGASEWVNFIDEAKMWGKRREEPARMSYFRIAVTKPGKCSTQRPVNCIILFRHPSIWPTVVLRNCYEIRAEMHAVVGEKISSWKMFPQFLAWNLLRKREEILLSKSWYMLMTRKQSTRNVFDGKWQKTSILGERW